MKRPSLATPLVQQGWASLVRAPLAGKSQGSQTNARIQQHAGALSDSPSHGTKGSRATLSVNPDVLADSTDPMLDLYHAQIGEGNLIELIRRCGDAIGEIQVADVPGRCEPGTGEINYPAIARTLAELGYTGVVGLEAFASSDSDLALERFRTAFTL